MPDQYHKVHQVDFKVVYINPAAGTMLNIWNLNSENIPVEIYKKDALNNAELIQKYGIRNFISDVTRNRFNITPDLQLWYAEEAALKLEEAGLEKCAIIINADLNMLSSLEEIFANVLKRNHSRPIPHRFFQNLEEAHKWVGR